MTSATSAMSGSERLRQAAGGSPACTCGAARVGNAGFTLVELLVVIGIIVLLIGILLPVISRATKQANRARTASDLNAISAALEAYKGDFGDYPRIIYGASSTGVKQYIGIGSGASVLGKALLSPGNASVPGAYGTATYTVGQVVENGLNGDYAAVTTVPPGNAPADPSTFWTPLPISPIDGADGPGFRIRTGGSGRIYGPYLQADKFKMFGLAIEDAFGNPILYFPANPSKPNITVDATPAAVFGGGNSYIGTPQGVSPGAAATKTVPPPCASLFNYSDNDTGALNAFKGSIDFPPTFQSIYAMEAMLGDYNMNGFIDSGETAATTASFLLWSAGPDGLYGPAGTLFPAGASAPSLDSTTVKNIVINCDDVTNFSFAP